METKKNSILRQIYLEKNNEPVVWGIISVRKIILEDGTIYSLN